MMTSAHPRAEATTAEQKFSVAPYAVVLLVAWTVLLALGFWWEHRLLHSVLLRIARSQASTAIDKDLVYRQWVAMHGGVYVPVTPATQPNPWLAAMPERDIVTPGGRRLTLVNPAYMTRQVHELAAREYKAKGHITSLNPIRPENAPDDWEREALLSFERGATEAFRVLPIDGEDHLRSMRPLVTEERCLKCHAAQGYRLGQVRGGISVAQPMGALQDSFGVLERNLALACLGIWLLGVLAIGYGYGNLRRRLAERARAKAEVDALRERLLQREKLDAIGQLAGGVAHDFNNQLGAILGYAEMLEERLADVEQRRFAANIRAAATRSADLTRRLLAFGRKGKFRDEPVDVHRLVHEVASLLERSIDKRIALRLDLAAPSATVRGDASQIQNALLNLALNARDAMPGGGAIVFSTANGSMPRPEPGEELAEGPSLQVCVTDTGVGMAPETLRRIFEPFFTTKEPGKGTGLGLASVYGTVRNHGGAIRVASEPGKGSAFSLHLPLHEAAAAPASAPPSREARPGSGRILIVDDESLLLELTGESLRELGYEVVAATSAEQALAVFRDAWRSIDLVLLDLVMPGMGGRELFRALQKIDPRLRAIVVTGNSANGEAQELLDAGALGFLQKPFDRAELSAKVAAALRAGGASP